MMRSGDCEPPLSFAAVGMLGASSDADECFFFTHLFNSLYVYTSL